MDNRYGSGATGVIVMSEWMLNQTIKNYQNERLRAAEHDHLVEKTLRMREHGAPIYAVTLARIGGWLVASGSYLQAHYGNIKESISQELACDIPEDFSGEPFVTAHSQ
jgi:hypothetical protein